MCEESSGRYITCNTQGSFLSAAEAVFHHFFGASTNPASSDRLSCSTSESVLAFAMAF